ncbi:spindle and kinetochore-associated protein 1 homolog [Arachis stenosperma]|uniref:spindle and kinetochore-associated protein 1 homolog n=1 Tax=Arachis stenosperma TaxID=217475 RepID=UPI0025AD6BFF|nr:spindle and kinetochore-associated protein 1 homolog [Arachis stenosperma]
MMMMDSTTEASGSSLESLMSSFNARITHLQELVIARNMFPASSMADLSAVDAAVQAMELQVQAIKDRLREETQAIPKTKKLISASLKQQKKLQNMSLHAPSQLPDRVTVSDSNTSRCLLPEFSVQDPGLEALNLKVNEEPAPLPKEKKGRSSPPMWHVTASELDSLSSYMRGRLTLEKVNAAINDMASYAEANAQLIIAPKKKLAENLWEKALEIRDIATMEGVKGKHFFLEADIKGPSLKLDNTGKAILTVLRHLGRINETRVGHHRIIILQKPN